MSVHEEPGKATAKRLTNSQRRMLFRAMRATYPHVRYHNTPKWIARNGALSAYGPTRAAAIANLSTGNALTPQDETAVAAEIVKAHR